jgi:hypothetical protein
MTPKQDTARARIKDYRPKERPVWLVWAKTTSGQTVLRAVCDRQWLANDYRKWATHEKTIIAATVEKSVTNHLYAGLFEKGGIL